jgi:hypothetical protein
MTSHNLISTRKYYLHVREEFRIMHLYKLASQGFYLIFPERVLDKKQLRQNGVGVET